ncbi:hypothetical protein BDQ17DRAFT_1423127 [Cyathus striatus]|nr:hypothetical protein BDQ17DRAFT_1423127 [Cyathus striatus]
MSSSHKVVFPPPPPTVHALSPEQRSQLLRKTKKLGQLLGSSPHLLDEGIPNVLGPVQIELPNKDSRFPRSSVDSFSSSSSGSDDLCFEILTPLSTDSHSNHLPRSSTSLSRYSQSTLPGSFDKCSGPTQPLLRLAIPPSLETIPASPTPYSQYSPYSSLQSSPSTSRSHSRASSVDSFESSHQPYTISPKSMPHQRESLDDPSFIVPSANSVRLKKMDRLRKKLGDGVPVDLVFPEKPKATERRAPKDDEKWKTESSREIVLPSTPTIPRTNRNSNRISHSRDSLVGPTPHRARRNGDPTYTSTPKSAEPKAPLPTPVSTPSAMRQPLRPSNQRLWAIIESPEENGDAAARRSASFRKPPPTYSEY